MTDTLTEVQVHLKRRGGASNLKVALSMNPLWLLQLIGVLSGNFLRLFSCLEPFLRIILDGDST